MKSKFYLSAICILLSGLLLYSCKPSYADDWWLEIRYEEKLSAMGIMVIEATVPFHVDSDDTVTMAESKQTATLKGPLLEILPCSYDYKVEVPFTLSGRIWQPNPDTDYKGLIFEAELQGDSLDLIQEVTSDCGTSRVPLRDAGPIGELQRLSVEIFINSVFTTQFEIPLVDNAVVTGRGYTCTLHRGTLK